MINLVTFSSLYPNREKPLHGVFVEQRLLHLIRSGLVRSRVIAPVPWFPVKWAAFGRYAAAARVPQRESRHGIDVIHPRHLVIPKLGMAFTPFLMALAVRSTFRHMLSSGFEFEVVDAHYFYPDGVAAALVARRLGKPLVITARGTDVNLIPRYLLPRKQILWAARRASAVITVCQALKDGLTDLGVPSSHIHVLRNGVDLDRFYPVEKATARSHVGMDGVTLLSVGLLVPLKGHDVVIRALPDLPGVNLVVVGDGELRSNLEKLVRALELTDRVRFAGAVPPDELKYFYSAADALVLASSREGMANVLLESLACGTPVIATAAGGTPEVVSDPAAGVLMEHRGPDALVKAYRTLMRDYPARGATRRHAETFSWDSTTQGQLEIFSGLAS